MPLEAPYRSLTIAHRYPLRNSLLESKHLAKRVRINFQVTASFGGNRIDLSQHNLATLFQTPELETPLIIGINELPTQEISNLLSQLPHSGHLPETVADLLLSHRYLFSGGYFFHMLYSIELHPGIQGAKSVMPVTAKEAVGLHTGQIRDRVMITDREQRLDLATIDRPLRGNMPHHRMNRYAILRI